MNDLGAREAHVLTLITGALRLACGALPDESDLCPLVAQWADQCQDEAEIRADRPTLEAVGSVGR